MKFPGRFSRGALAAIVLGASLFAVSVQAQERRGGREHERERFHTPHWVLDERYRHNHYYPSVGYSIAILPAGNIAISFRSGRFFFHSGVWYQPAPSGYVVVRPPVGILVPVLPPAYATVWIGGVPYYYANEIYYSQAPGGYAVAAPPVEAMQGPAVQPQPPSVPPPQAGTAPGSPAQPSPGTWYYCESAKSYYPYVSACGEGWRPVPATPPPAR